MTMQSYEDEPAAAVPQAVHEITDYAEIDSVLMGAPPAAQFRDVGALVTGRILRVIARQATDFESKEPKWWPDGRPVLEPVITLDSSDGQLTLYAGSAGLREALREACRSAGIGLRPGGILAVRYIRDEPSKKGGSAKKIYDAAYDPPAGLPQPAQVAAKVAEASDMVRSRVSALVTQQEPPF